MRKSTKVAIKPLGFRRYNIMQTILAQAWDNGVSIKPGAWGKPSAFLTF